MKKFLLFVLMAAIIGGFTSNANAQIVKKSHKDAKSSVVHQKKGDTDKKENWNNVIKRYDLTVEKCLKMYKLLEAKDTKVNASDFEKCLKKATELKTKIEKGKDELNRSQINRFNKITAKLNQIYTKD